MINYALLNNLELVTLTVVHLKSIFLKIFLNDSDKADIFAKLNYPFTYWTKFSMSKSSQTLKFSNFTANILPPKMFDSQPLVNFVLLNSFKKNVSPSCSSQTINLPKSSTWKLISLLIAELLANKVIISPKSIPTFTFYAQRSLVEVRVMYI